AWAQGADKSDKGDDDPQIVVERRIEVGLDIRVKGKDEGPGKGLVEANCEPYTCFAVTKEVSLPGDAKAIIAVSGTKKKSDLDAPESDAALSPFRKSASEEREVAEEVIPDIAAAVAAVGVASLA